MAESNKTNRRLTPFITLITAGIFLLGVSLIPLLANSQQKALDSTAPIFPPITLDYPAPQLTLTDLQGKPVSIEDYRGQVILVNNWATWCPPCKTEMPELQAFYTAHAAEGFVVVAIESGEPADQVASFVQEYGMSFPVWLDPHGTALEIFQNWNLPSSYVIDRDGKVRLSWTGAINQPTLEQYITPLFEEIK
ncbi:MAG: TlpA family protein disulfide reductase [Chloroflexi bacterium]|nr:TlpA family protein disulfide reductase [Chloroflexota bacterium]